MKIVVTNNGDKVRNRNSVSLQPGETKEIEVDPRSYFVFSAVRDFSVQVKDEESGETEDPQREVSGGQGEEPSGVDGETVAMFQDSTVDEGLDMVRSGMLSVDKALEVERANKNRSTMLHQLEEMNS